MRTYFITGASSGFGETLAKAVLARGDRAVLTARRRERLSAFAASYPDSALALPLDVTEAGARSAAIEQAIERFGCIDVLANIAGRGSLGAAEEFTEVQLRSQLELNFFAAAELTRAVLPHMRAQGHGHILQLTSAAGLAGVGGCTAYCASKFALEGWSEALQQEVAPLGIHVTIVEPGSFRTEFAGDRVLRPDVHIDAYRPLIEPINSAFVASSGKQPGDPARAAEVIIAAVESDAPPLHLILGHDAMRFWTIKRDLVDHDLEAWKDVSLTTAFPDAPPSSVA